MSKKVRKSQAPKKTTQTLTFDPTQIVFNFNKVNKEVGNLAFPIYELELKEPFKSTICAAKYGQGTRRLNEVLSQDEYKELERLMKKVQKALSKQCDKKIKQTVTHKNTKIIDVDYKTLEEA